MELRYRDESVIGIHGDPALSESHVSERVGLDCFPLLSGCAFRPRERTPLRCVESCVGCQLRCGGFFCNLSRESVAAFNKIRHAAVFPEHAVVLVEGQKPWGIFILCQGRAKLSTTSRDGKTLIVRIAEPGEVLGLHAILTGGTYELTVETMQPCQLNFVAREDMLGFLRDHKECPIRFCATFRVPMRRPSRCSAAMAS